MNPLYITTAIPYVNAAPHLGHALELVETDVLARHARFTRTAGAVPHRYRRSHGQERRAPRPQPGFRSRRSSPRTHTASPRCAHHWASRTTTSSGRRPTSVTGRRSNDCGRAAQRRATSTAGATRVCSAPAASSSSNPTTCRRRVSRSTLRAPGAGRRRNWFFRLSRYQAPLREALTSGRLRIQPEARRNEVLAFVDGGLRDFSVSRPGTDPTAGASPFPATDPDHLRVVRRARQLHQRARLRQRRRRLHALVEQRQRSGARGRQGHPPVPRDLLAGNAALGRTAAPDHGVRARLPHGRRHQDLEVARQHRRPGRARRSVWHRRAPLVAVTRGAPCRRRRLHRRRARRHREPRSRQRCRQPRGAGWPRACTRHARVLSRAWRLPMRVIRAALASASTARSNASISVGRSTRSPSSSRRRTGTSRRRSRGVARAPGSRARRGVARTAVEAAGRLCAASSRRSSPTSRLGRGMPSATAAASSRPRRRSSRVYHPRLFFGLDDTVVAQTEETGAVTLNGSSVCIPWVSRRKRSGAGDPSARSATSSPTTGANLKP